MQFYQAPTLQGVANIEVEVYMPNLLASGILGSSLFLLLGKVHASISIQIKCFKVKISAAFLIC